MVYHYYIHNPIENFDYAEEAEIVNDTWELKTKLQDSLIVLPKIVNNIELILMIKNRQISDANTKIAMLEYTLQKKGLL